MKAKIIGPLDYQPPQPPRRPWTVQQITALAIASLLIGLIMLSCGRGIVQSLNNPF